MLCIKGLVATSWSSSTAPAALASALPSVLLPLPGGPATTQTVGTRARERRRDEVGLTGTLCGPGRADRHRPRFTRHRTPGSRTVVRADGNDDDVGLGATGRGWCGRRPRTVGTTAGTLPARTGPGRVHRRRTGGSVHLALRSTPSDGTAAAGSP
ncbi:hypothetical protein GCM10011594_33640 [Nakamurella endophytica]|uniref:Secreted protein n=1 Tax=Nakamurella endophytica TaxID=1748367 RepID=A0A917WKN5_9ACTN|nr:hypothetical protein GCM10011594_33640 [Nakamurella endophytica]